LQETVRLWTNGSIKEAKPTTFLNFEQIESGLRTLQSGKGMGKMVFVPSPQDKVSFVPPRPAPYQLSPNASYVLAGGLGGIGRTAARNMVANGARNLIFLSSSGRITPEVELLLADLEAAKCKVCVYTCDVSDEHRLADVLNECQKNMPPIKGVIQGAMKLVVSFWTQGGLKNSANRPSRILCSITWIGKLSKRLSSRKFKDLGIYTSYSLKTWISF
jgi:hypothetical protein